ncbi:MAG: Glycine cleavage system H protein [Fimbriimonadaceae bacterium]|nr:Glycine cleavage system H protein [Fimbriimonadaceae bacterium]
MNVPNELKYTKSHEWVRIEGDIATIGITEHAQAELGDIVFVELPNVGRALQNHQTFGTVESVKTVSDLYAPVEGEVVETNPALGGQPELVNSDPYGNGWMIKVRTSGGADHLLDADGYRASLES